MNSQIRVQDVFGITSSVPTYTYVDRAGLDARFELLLDTDKHMVLHGASKQGKTVLRRKSLPEEQCVVVQCRTNWKLEDLYDELLSRLNVLVATETTKSVKTTVSGELKVQGEGSVPMVAKIAGDLSGGFERENGAEVKTVPAVKQQSTLSFLIDAIKVSGKRVVLEDLHYLEEDQRKRLATDLKAFYEESVFFVMVGVWADQSIFNFYNPDLSGRIEEIDPRWTEQELTEVLNKGQSALNIDIDEELVKQIVADSYRNVGLLQSLAFRFCVESDVTKWQWARKKLTDKDPLQRARLHICQELGAKYTQMARVFERGFRKSTELHVYQNILRIAVQASEAELMNGLAYSDVFDRIHKINSAIRASDLTAALNKIARLQVDNGMQRPILSYQSRSRIIQLVDVDLLFYKKYSDHQWPWLTGDDDDEAPRESMVLIEDPDFVE